MNVLQHEISPDRKALLARLAAIVARQCFNPSMQNQWGEEPDGRQFQYPMRWLEDGKKPRSAPSLLSKLPAKSIRTIHCAFGANKLYLVQALDLVLDYLENHHTLAISDFDRIAEEAEFARQEQQRLENERKKAQATRRAAIHAELVRELASTPDRSIIQLSLRIEPTVLDKYWLARYCVTPHGGADDRHRAVYASLVSRIASQLESKGHSELFDDPSREALIVDGVIEYRRCRLDAVSRAAESLRAKSGDEVLRLKKLAERASLHYRFAREKLWPDDDPEALAGRSEHVSSVVEELAGLGKQTSIADLDLGILELLEAIFWNEDCEQALIRSAAVASPKPSDSGQVPE